MTEHVLRAMEGTTLDLLGVNEKNGSNGGGNGGRRRRKGGSRGGKPNCVILDEIGSANAKLSIAALVDIVRADVPPPAGSSYSSRGKRGRGGTACGVVPSSSYAITSTVIGHGIGGINFLDIMAQLAKMQDRWSKR